MNCHALLLKTGARASFLMLHCPAKFHIMLMRTSVRKWWRCYVKAGLSLPGCNLQYCISMKAEMLDTEQVEQSVLMRSVSWTDSYQPYIKKIMSKKKRLS